VKKWLCAWIVFTLYLVVNMTVMETAEQPHLVATLLLGFFFYLIFGMRGVYGAMAAVSCIVLLAVLAHPFRSPLYEPQNYGAVLVQLLLDVVTIMGGGGMALWLQRMIPQTRK